MYDLSWSPDSRYIFTGSLDHTSQVWDVFGRISLPIHLLTPPERYSSVQEFRGHAHYVQGVAWDPWDSLCTSFILRSLTNY